LKFTQDSFSKAIVLLAAALPQQEAEEAAGEGSPDDVGLAEAETTIRQRIKHDENCPGGNKRSLQLGRQEIHIFLTYVQLPLQRQCTRIVARSHVETALF
jgi:hypothetical protein